MQDQTADKFEILRQLAVSGARGEDLSRVSQRALGQTARYVGLTAAAVYLWNDQSEVTLSVSHAETENSRRRLQSLEEELFRGLRRDRNVVSAYMSFGGEPPVHAFTLPLQYAGKIFGAVIGLQEGDRSIVAQDYFLEALSALMALNHLAAGLSESSQPAREVLDKERLAAIVETAVTVNHEVNNPLTAILGNVQLLLLKRQDLDADLVAKLKTIEASALKIKDVTQRLMQVTSPKSVEYSEGTRMLDLSSDKETDPSAT